MRQLIAALVGLVLACSAASAAVTLHATSTASLFREPATAWAGTGCVEASGPFDYDYLLLDNAAPASGTTESFTPSATSPPCHFQRTANTYFTFVSEPISGSFTISGNISGVCSGIESATTTNCGCTQTLFKWNGRRGGLTQVWTGNVGNEFGTSCATKAIAASAPTSTAVVAGDRLFLVTSAYAIATTTPGSWAGNDSRTCGLCFNGAAAGANEVSVTLTETVTFSADAAAPTTMERVRP